MSAKSAVGDAAEKAGGAAKKAAGKAADAVEAVAEKASGAAKGAAKKVAAKVSDVVADSQASAGARKGGAVQTHAEGRGFRKTREGLVVSDKMDKTVVVAVENRVKHPVYGKVVRRTSKLKAHDEQNSCGIGDRVLLMETRPLSATKRWRIVQILEKAQ